MSQDEQTYNPLDKRNLGASVAEALLERRVRPLRSLEPFVGAGIYAIYYKGAHSAYTRMAEANREGEPAWPIYVGKAVPAGARKGNGDRSETRALHKRLREHAESVSAVSSLQVDDFECRFLVVDDIWIPLGESLLIAKFSPIWNTLIDGFGNHDPGSGRYQGLRPRWDVLHPGRAWAEKCQARDEVAEDIEREVVSYLASVPWPVRIKFHAEQPKPAYRAARKTKG